MAEEDQRNRRLVSETYPSKRHWKNGNTGCGEATDRGHGKNLRETYDRSEVSCYRREVWTMEGILGLLFTNSSRTLRTSHIECRQFQNCSELFLRIRGFLR